MDGLLFKLLVIMHLSPSKTVTNKVGGETKNEIRKKMKEQIRRRRLERRAKVIMPKVHYISFFFGNLGKSCAHDENAKKKGKEHRKISLHRTLMHLKSSRLN